MTAFSSTSVLSLFAWNLRSVYIRWRVSCLVHWRCRLNLHCEIIYVRSCWISGLLLPTRLLVGKSLLGRKLGLKVDIIGGAREILLLLRVRYLNDVVRTTFFSRWRSFQTILNRSGTFGCIVIRLIGVCAFLLVCCIRLAWTSIDWRFLWLISWLLISGPCLFRFICFIIMLLSLIVIVIIVESPLIVKEQRLLLISFSGLRWRLHSRAATLHEWALPLVSIFISVAVPAVVVAFAVFLSWDDIDSSSFGFTLHGNWMLLFLSHWDIVVPILFIFFPVLAHSMHRHGCSPSLFVLISGCC